MTAPIPPLVLSPANIWAGNDGNWSTWAIKVGSSLQSFNILPSTSNGEVFVPELQGCISSSTPSLCAESRGVGEFQDTQSLGFQENASSTWEQIGIYEFVTGGDLFQTTETGLYGLDDVVIGEHNTSVQHTTVAGVVTRDFWLGSLGLANVHSEFPIRDESLPSLLDKMKEGNLMSSVSFSLAVGAAYSEYQCATLQDLADARIAETAPGSLIIGGYDQGLYQDPGVEIQVTANKTRSLVAHVRSIVASNTLNGTLSAAFDLPSLPMAIDSGVSQLWLPPQVCENLAGALGLTFDNLTGLYLVNNTARTRLLELSPEFTFTVAANATSRETTNIVLPYAAFDLEVGQPVYNTSRRYFPIRQAPTNDLYVLGRAFLQEAYLIVDWERGNFTVSPYKHQSTGQGVVAIPPLGDAEAGGGAARLSPGAVAGIVVGALSALAVTAIAVHVMCRRRKSVLQRASDRDGTSSPFPEDKKGADASELSDTGTIVAEASSVAIHELHQDSLRQQLMSTPVYELPGVAVEQELETGRWKAAKSGDEAEVPERDGGGVKKSAD
jgi:hypothetical protein